MASLVAVTFEGETTAFSMRAALGKLQKEYLIDMEDVVVVRPLACSPERGAAPPGTEIAPAVTP